MYTTDNFIYKKLLEDSHHLFLEDFYSLYSSVEEMDFIKPPRQGMEPNKEWRGLYAYFQARKKQPWLPRAFETMKNTRKTLESLPPNTMLGVWYSALLPGGKIGWHADVQDNPPYVRIHLPLIMPPPGDIQMQVENRVTKQIQDIYWSTGKVAVLDPEDRHTVWNYTDKLRLNVNFNFSTKSFTI